VSATAERAFDVKQRLHADMRLTFMQHNIVPHEDLLDALVDDALFHVEHLLDEIETYREARQ